MHPGPRECLRETDRDGLVRMNTEVLEGMMGKASPGLSGAPPTLPRFPGRLQPRPRQGLRASGPPVIVES